MRVASVVFDGYLAHRRATFGRSLLALPRGLLAGAGAILGLLVLALLLLVRWRLHHPPAGVFLDLEGDFLAAVLGVMAACLIVVGGVLIVADGALWLHARMIRATA